MAEGLKAIDWAKVGKATGRVKLSSEIALI